jgi:hypothetical protein
MSDTIDATPTHSVPPASSTTGTTTFVPQDIASTKSAVMGGRDRCRFFTARDLVQLTQGLYFIFLGLLMTVLVGAQLLVTAGAHSLSEGFLGAGVMAIIAGSWRLQRVKCAHGHWTQWTQWLLFWAVILAYGCVTFYAWLRLPTNLYLMGNAAAFVLFIIGYVIIFSRVVAALAEALGRREMMIESRLLTVADIVLLLLPIMGGMGYVAELSRINASHPLIELHYFLSNMNPLIILVVLLPLSLTLSMTWAAKDATLQQLDALSPAADTAAHDSSSPRT